MKQQIRERHLNNERDRNRRLNYYLTLAKQRISHYPSRDDAIATMSETVSMIAHKQRTLAHLMNEDEVQHMLHEYWSMVMEIVNRSGLTLIFDD